MRIYPFRTNEIKIMKTKDEIKEWKRLMREEVGLDVNALSGSLDMSVTVCPHGACDCDDEDKV